LHAAAEGGNAQIVSALRRAGAEGDINTTCSASGSTPLHLAISGGHEAAAGVLMMAGADVNILDTDGTAPLHLAIWRGHVGVAKDLLLSGANPNQKHPGNPLPFYDALSRGLDLLRQKGSFPIHVASRRGLDEVVRALVQRGADLDSLDADDYTPLFRAVQQDHVSTMKVLLAEGANVNVRSRDSMTVLHKCMAWKKPAAIPALLVEAGADIEARSGHGRTPLHEASSVVGSCGGMLTLLQLGADVNARDSTGSTPLHVAGYNGDPEVVDLLLRWGADETAVDNNGDT
ncbi:unnamed protein product, partial [Ectocarpus sp. 8 AP-2014]